MVTIFFKHKTTLTYISLIIYIIPFLFFGFGCRSTKALKASPVHKEKKSDLVWPKPPDEPKIQFIKTITTKKKLGSIGEKKERDDSKGSFLKKFGYWSKIVFRIIVGLPTFFTNLFGEKKKEVGIKRPYGITVDELGRIYVADRELSLVHQFDYIKGVYSQIKKTAAGLLAIPIGVTSDSQNNVYISDSYLKKIYVYSNEGNFIGTIGNNYPFMRPTGLAINKELGLLYIVDTHAHKIVVFSLDGTYQFEFGDTGPKEDRFHFPTNIFIDKDNFVYVTDSMNFCIKIFTGVGKLIGKIGEIGDKIGYFSKPKGVAVDSEGHIYQVESFFDRIQIFDKKGNLLLFFGQNGRGDGEFWLPSGIFIDTDDKIYIADDYNSRVQVFQYLSQAYKDREKMKKIKETQQGLQ